MNLFPKTNTSLSPAEEEQVFKLRSALCHIELKGGLDGFAGTRSEKLALLATFDNQGLIKWNRTIGRHELSREGRKCLRFVSKPQGAGKGQAGPWMVRRRRAASVRMIAIVAVALICGGSMVWVTGMSSSSLALSKDKYAIEEVGLSAVAASRPEIVQASPMQVKATAPAAPAVNVASSPPIMAADDDPPLPAAVPAPGQKPRKPEARAVPAQEPVPATAMTRKVDGAAAPAPEKRKRVSHKRQKTPKSVRRDGGRNFGFGGGMRWFMKMI